MQHERETIGFIGLGLMGHGMAKNMVEKGYDLTVCARKPSAALDDLLSRGAKQVDTPMAVAQQATVVFLCVTGSPDVESIVRGRRGWQRACGPVRWWSIALLQTRRLRWRWPQNSLPSA